VLSLFGLLSVIPVLAQPLARTRAGLARFFVLLVLFFCVHAAAGVLIFLPSTHTLFDAGWMIAGVGFAVLFVVRSVLIARPSGRLARALHPWLYAGLYLDESFTRLTFLVWPPRMRSASMQPRAPILVAWEK